jgi:hypothetical protein
MPYKSPAIPFRFLLIIVIAPSPKPAASNIPIAPLTGTLLECVLLLVPWLVVAVLPPVADLSSQPPSEVSKVNNNAKRTISEAAFIKNLIS